MIMRLLSTLYCVMLLWFLKKAFVILALLLVNMRYFMNTGIPMADASSSI